MLVVKMNDIRILFIIILVAVLIFGGCGRQESSKSVVEKSGEQVPASEVKMTSIEQESKRIVSERSLPIDTYGRSNPFAPVAIKSTASKERKRAGLNLEGLITGSGQPLAMINDRIVKEGDTIDDKKIIKIDIESVTLEDEDGRKYILRLI